jgi:hypothetical protein
MTNHYEKLRTEIDLGLSKLEQAGAPVEDALEAPSPDGCCSIAPPDRPRRDNHGTDCADPALEQAFPEHAKAARNSAPLVSVCGYQGSGHHSPAADR